MNNGITIRQVIALIKELGGTGTGEGGTSDYSELSNKPFINGIELTGNKTAQELGIGGKAYLWNGQENLELWKNVYNDAKKGLDVTVFLTTTPFYFFQFNAEKLPITGVNLAYGSSVINSTDTSYSTKTIRNMFVTLVITNNVVAAATKLENMDTQLKFLETNKKLSYALPTRICWFTSNKTICR